jgi:hypothetical protein
MSQEPKSRSDNAQEPWSQARSPVAVGVGRALRRAKRAGTDADGRGA